MILLGIYCEEVKRIFAKNGKKEGAANTPTLSYLTFKIQ